MQFRENDFAYILIYLAIGYVKVYGTIDVNLSELEYLAARLDPFECRRLIAALHYTTYNLPQNLAAADFFFTRCQNLSKRYVIRYIIVRIFLCGKERKVDEEIPCLRQLLHWNEHPAEGRGKTHAAIVHRLRQIGRDDLADWLGKTAFKQLGKDLNDAIAPSPEMPSVDEQTETLLILTLDEIPTVTYFDSR
ncbi:uncharacterized protein LOC116842714 [Odontomachus brunneus]|uniref:uncharacterized protein LOC116842714 n=1 Tax=Odontomachus brunneus TaxID=486640 RepID=UPI0013F1D388|nr:uncharacterized protein LOC116842714 [Odontomachus brunneus]